MKKPGFLAKKNKFLCSAVILAAGSSERMGYDKLMSKLGGKLVLKYSLDAFENSPYIDEIVIVTREDRMSDIAQLCKEGNYGKVTSVVCGGSTRAESSLAGVSAIKHCAKYVLIHDAARPLVSDTMIENIVKAVYKKSAVIPVTPCVNTMKIISDDTVCGGVDRDSIFNVQTPQAFDTDIIKGALTYAVKESIPVTDDSSAVELLGMKVFTVPGDEFNIKLTRPLDFLIAEAFLKDRG